MSNCPECDVINYGINPSCVACVRKVMGDRIAKLKAELAELEKDQQELVYDCRDHRIAKEKAEAQLADLRDACNEKQEIINSHNEVDRLRVEQLAELRGMLQTAWNMSDAEFAEALEGK